MAASTIKARRAEQITAHSGELLVRLLKGGRVSLGKFTDRFGNGTATIGVNESGMFISFKYGPLTSSARRALVLNNGERVVQLNHCTKRFATKWLKRLIAQSLES